jgi:hypothetical protein
MDFILFILFLLFRRVSSSTRVLPSKRAIFTLVGVKNLLPSLVSSKTDGNYGKSFWNSRDLYTTISINDHDSVHFYVPVRPTEHGASFVEVKEYQPKLFRLLRCSSGFTETEYLNSLAQLRLIPSDNVDSRSKQFFWKSSNDKLIVKTIKSYEKRNFCALLPSLKNHLLRIKPVCCFPVLSSYYFDTAETLINPDSQSNSIFGLPSSCLPSCLPSCLSNVAGFYRISVYHRHGYLLSKQYVLVSRNIFSSLSPFPWSSLLSSCLMLSPHVSLDPFVDSSLSFIGKSFLCSCSTFSTCVQLVVSFGFLVNHCLLRQVGLMSNDFKQCFCLFFGSDTQSLPHSVLYDLKGSLVGRRKSSSSAVFKDQDFLNNQEWFHLSNVSKKILMDVLNRDTSFLSKHNIMDYSVLVRVDEPFFRYTASFFPLVSRYLSGR